MHAAVELHVLDDLLEAVVVDAEHDAAEHLDEAAVAVPGEARRRRRRRPGPSTVASFRPRFSTVSIMPGMETRAPERTETSSGLWWSPKLVADRLLDPRQRRGRPGRAARAGYCCPCVVVVGADLGGDGEAGRHGQADAGHLRQVGALAAEQVAHVRAALVVAGAEAVDPLGHRRVPLADAATGAAYGACAVAMPAVQPSILEKSATASMAAQSRLSKRRRLRRSSGSGSFTVTLVEEGVHRGAQARPGRPWRAAKSSRGQRGGDRRLGRRRARRRAPVPRRGASRRGVDRAGMRRRPSSPRCAGCWRRACRRRAGWRRPASTSSLAAPRRGRAGGPGRRRGAAPKTAATRSWRAPSARSWTRRRSARKSSSAGGEGRDHRRMRRRPPAAASRRSASRARPPCRIPGWRWLPIACGKPKKASPISVGQAQPQPVLPDDADDAERRPAQRDRDRREPVGFSSDREEAGQLVQLVGQRHRDRHRLGRHRIARAERPVMRADRLRHARRPRRRRSA